MELTADFSQMKTKGEMDLIVQRTSEPFSTRSVCWLLERVYWKCREKKIINQISKSVCILLNANGGAELKGMTRANSLSGGKGE